MNILIINGSPAGKDSITLFTMRYIQQHFPEHRYETIHAGQQIRKLEKDTAWREQLAAADLIVFCYPVYTFLVPAQLHRFIELIVESGVDLRGKYATQLTTSKHFYDMTAHRFIQDCCGDLGLRYVRGLSADMEDLRHEQGQQEALAFFRHTLWSMAQGFAEPAFPRPAPAELKKADPEAAPLQVEKKPERIVIAADFSHDGEGRLRAMVERLRHRLPCATEVADVGAFPFAGGCLGCFHCAADGQCVYRDGFDAWLREKIQTADAIVYACSIRNHSMGSRFKLYDDRQFCNGHRTVTMGKPVAYLVDGDLAPETNLQTVMEARAEVGGNALAGIAVSGRDPDREIDQLAASLCYAVAEHWLPPKNFYGVGGLKIFRDLIWQMQGLMRADHRFYKQHGFYDFPQKKRGTMMAMYLVGGMMKSPKLRKKMGGKMTEGMTLPYRQVLERDGKKTGRKG